MAFSIHLDGASQAALDALSKTLAARMKYLNETVSASAHAILSQTLRSIRAATKVAKTRGIKVGVKQRGDLKASYTTNGKWHRMCIRNGAGARVRPVKDKLGLRFPDAAKGIPLKSFHVYEYAHPKKTYLIVAQSKAAAQAAAKKIVIGRIRRSAGLARAALTVLMVKTNNKGALDAVDARINNTARKETTTRETVVKTATGGVYTLTALDNLRYAKLAVNGESAAIDLAVRKAVNKSVGLITHRFKDQSFFKPGDLPPVFPEVKQRRSA